MMDSGWMALGIANAHRHRSRGWVRMEYRLYCLDEKDQIVSARNFLALDDLTALVEAEGACAKNAVELWQGARRVARVKLGNAPLDASDRMSL